MCYALRNTLEDEMTYLSSALYLFMYLVVVGTGVGVLRATGDDPHSWTRETAFIIGTAALLVAWIFASG